jgi:hypothetical protein
MKKRRLTRRSRTVRGMSRGGGCAPIESLRHSRNLETTTIGSETALVTMASRGEQRLRRAQSSYQDIQSAFLSCLLLRGQIIRQLLVARVHRRLVEHQIPPFDAFTASLLAHTYIASCAAAAEILQPRRLLILAATMSNFTTAAIWSVASMWIPIVSEKAYW